MKLTPFVIVSRCLILWSMALSVFSGQAQAQTVQAWGTGTLGQTTVPAGLSNVTAVAGGWEFSTALRGDGTVAAWGKNDYQQATVPPGLNGVVSISSGHWHSLAVRMDGTVTSWGAYKIVPNGLNTVTAVSASGHSLALRGDGTIVAWGVNDQGQANVPAGLTDVIAVSAGEKHSLALKADGTVIAWGYNFQGQASVPAGLSQVTAIAAGAYHNVALRENGTVAAWGQNTSGQLNIPAGLTGVIAIAAGAYHSFAWRADGSVVTWGRAIPGVLSLPAGFTSAMAARGGVNHSIALVPDATMGSRPLFISPAKVLAAQGSPLQHRVVAAKRTQPFTVTGLPEGLQFNAASGLLSGTLAQAGVFSLEITAQNDAGSTTQILALTANAPFPLVTSSLAVTSYGKTPINYRITGGNNPTSFSATGLPPGLTLDSNTGWITGTPQEVNTFPVTLGVANAYGEGSDTLILQVLTIASYGYPYYGVATVPPGLAQIVEISETTSHALARRADGTVTGWGNNTNGQLDIPAGLSGVTAVSAGDGFSLALKADGTVVSWGGTLYPVPAGLSDVVAISAGSSRRMALKRNGTVTVWGTGERPPAGLSQVIAIAAGYDHSLALRADGTVAGWGDPYIVPPSIVAPLQSITSISAGYASSTVLRADDNLRGWGQDWFSTNWMNWMYPLTGVVDISTGFRNVRVLKDDGSLVAWGNNDYGQMNPPAGFGPVAAVESGYYHTSELSATEPGVTQPLLMNSCFAMGGVQLPFHWRIRARNLPDSFAASDLPPGLSVDSGTGVISGTPLQAGSFPATISAHNTAGTAQMAVTFTILSTPAPAFQNATAAATYSGSPFSFQLLTNHTIATYTATGLPLGLTLNGSTGLISGTCLLEGTFPVSITGVNPYGTVSAILDLKVATPAAWGGANQYGETTVPAGLTGVTAMAGGSYHSAALRRDGTVVAWGQNTDNALAIPPQLSGVVAIAARGSSTMALKNDSTVTAWGGAITVPAGLSNVVAVAPGAEHALALKRDGTVTAWAWGSNAYGQATVPAGLKSVVAISAGDYFSVALKADGTVIAWGTNEGTQTTIPTGLSGIVAIASSRNNTSWLKSDGSVGAFGLNAPSSALTGAIQIAAGDAQTLALLSSGSITRWGSSSPAPPAALSNAALLAAGTSHFLALTTADPSVAGPVILNSPFALGVRSTPFYFRTFTRNGGGGVFSAVGLPSGLTINATTGIITGTTLLTGAYPVKLGVSTTAGTVEKTLFLTINGTTNNYAQWVNAWFTAAEQLTPGMSDAGADPDADGIPNRLEAACGTNPKSPDSAAAGFSSVPGGTTAAPRLAGEFTMALLPPLNLTYSVEVSSSLAPGTWTTLAQKNGTGPWSAGVTVTEANGRAIVKATDTQPMSEGGRRYLRFIVSGP